LRILFWKIFKSFSSKAGLATKAMTFTLKRFHFAASQCAKHLIVSLKERTSGSLEPLFPIKESLHQIK
jgi:hypothetical protein